MSQEDRKWKKTAGTVRKQRSSSRVPGLIVFVVLPRLPNVHVRILRFFWIEQEVRGDHWMDSGLNFRINVFEEVLAPREYRGPRCRGRELEKKGLTDRCGLVGPLESSVGVPRMGSFVFLSIPEESLSFPPLNAFFQRFLISPVFFISRWTIYSWLISKSHHSGTMYHFLCRTRNYVMDAWQSKQEAIHQGCTQFWWHHTWYIGNKYEVALQFYETNLYLIKAMKKS